MSCWEGGACVVCAEDGEGFGGGDFGHEPDEAVAEEGEGGVGEFVA